MPPALVDRLQARQFTFVVGKGGTGKSTTASALALGSADSGRRTLLLSTDPAHSIADIFSIRLESGVRPASACSDDLLLEELNAETIAAAWLERARAPLEQLIARGTYLSDADIARLTHLTLPGLDEIAAALRLAELSASGITVVVDTAPTGHTLRLLDAPALIDSWVAAFRAMADKASAVSMQMVGAHVRDEGEQIVEDLERTAAELRRVFGDAAFVITTRSGEVVQAETSRLLAALGGKSLHIAAVVRMIEPGVPDVALAAGPNSSSDAGPASYVIPVLPDVRGCAGLRGWSNAVRVRTSGAPSTGTTANETASHGPATAESHLTGAADVLRSQIGAIAWFAGKGGTGKSTCAAAAAVCLAGDRPVLLCSTDPAGSLGDIFGIRPAREGVRVLPRLRVLQVDAMAELESWRGRHRTEVEGVLDAVGLGTAAALDRAVVTAALDVIPPGVDELLSLGMILDAAEGDETILVDASPTGHFLRLLASPAAALDWTHAVLRIILDYGVAGTLDGFSERVLAFARQLKHLSALLTDPARCGVFVVSLREPVVEAETDRLIESLRAAHVHIAARIINRTIPAECPSPADTVMCAPVHAAPLVGVSALERFLAEWRVPA